jgi:hypothetical protein
MTAASMAPSTSRQIPYQYPKAAVPLAADQIPQKRAPAAMPVDTHSGLTLPANDSIVNPAAGLKA